MELPLVIHGCRMCRGKCMQQLPYLLPTNPSFLYFQGQVMALFVAAGANSAYGVEIQESVRGAHI